MKKFYIIALTFSLVAVPTLAATPQPMIVNGYNLSVETRSQNGTLLVPLRKVGDLLNLSSYYLKDSNQIMITTQIYGVNKDVTMTIGSKTAIIDNQATQTMQIAPIIVNGVTYVPLRFISEVFGCSINYSNGLVIIEKNPGISDVNTTNKGYSTPIDSPEISTSLNNMKNNNSNNSTTNTTLTNTRMDYLSDSVILKEYYDIIKQANDILLDSTKYTYNSYSYKRLADKIIELSSALSTESIVTPEGKKLKNALQGELKMISTELNNVYTGSGLDLNHIISTSNTTLDAMITFATVLERLNL